EEDRQKMIKNYPFFEYIWKDINEKGHYISMNKIHDIACKKYKYVVHVEDDWHFIEKRNYISESIKILENDLELGQVLFNKNYAEIEPYKKRIPGGITKMITNKLKYILHEHYEPHTEAYNKFANKYRKYGTNAYWPHFSLRPSLI